MVRKLALSLLVTAFILVACGRQVTPDRAGVGPGGLLPGRMLIRVRTANPMDFVHVHYVIPFNISGTGGTPYSNAWNTGWTNYTFVFAVGAAPNGQTSVQLFRLIPQPNGQGVPSQYPILFSTQQVQFNPNSNGSGTEFTINFDRTLFLAGPSPSPGPTSSPMSTWYFNFITVDGTTQQPLDALGVGGPNDTSFSLPLPVSTTFDFINELTVPQGATQAPVPAAQLQGGEIANNP